MKKDIWPLGGVAIFFAGIGLFFGVKKWEPLPASSNAGTHLFAQSLPDLTGKIQPLSQWKGKTLVINFWATWCAPCIEEMPDLSLLNKQASAHNFQILGISVDSVDKVHEFAAKYKISYPLYIAGMEGSDLSRQMGNSKGGLPFTVILGADGQVKKSYLGRLNMRMLRQDLGLL
jgi:thiol-disulfide isomerase/thioredoxin